MTSLNRPARLNRVLLALTGVLLLAAGGFGLGIHFGLLGLLDPASPLVPGTAEPPAWVFYVVAAGAVVLGLLTLRWLLAQLARRPRTQTWNFESSPARGRTELHADTAVAPFTEELRTYSGVLQAKSTLTGSRQQPVLALVITSEQEADLGEIRERITSDGLPRLRQALDLADLPVTIEFRFSARTGSRVS
ncbi:alkaline shock response membrane anchor protein AmaP [Amycolatopsis sp. 195334CR]|uniref:alkaline shock response membrane anchor protein AmaP n=1 Tax=Amycolatopsis sp. 195334CR TaxID=2814588 RepID=UPI001A8E8471|nr:alkaline shock response membrane anchor protein AmaP [Amycolatopsis sp. 195334CR]MBN6038499.1 alkaline shock response membrane anchor protein AmaP [Amycolatopsis sp. 195334CR]